MITLLVLISMKTSLDNIMLSGARNFWQWQTALPKVSTDITVMDIYIAYTDLKNNLVNSK